MIWALIPNWLKFAAGGLLCAVLLASGSYWLGKREGRSQTQIAAAKEALDRINQLEKNNASFRSLTDRGRCLVFMRDSGLPDSACD
ncbi:hypothetical protein [Agrobacterium tumefaciens]|uniref:hypothetical protein n=1 Tax=Agrobacterium tumefaciens TaxID=358 RepID=UPI0015742AB3|nr:hypothetical protein [Agrobacterium tumefaciens]NTD10002.1 hypothetical protein [Agrobacterium tumefaciens]